MPLPLPLYFASFSNASIVESATSSLCYLIWISNPFLNILLLYSSTLDPMRQPLFFVETMSTANLDGPDALEVVEVEPSILPSRDPHLVSLLPPRRNTSCGRNCFVKRLVPTRNSPLWKDVPLSWVIATALRKKKGLLMMPITVLFGGGVVLTVGVDRHYAICVMMTMPKELKRFHRN